MTVAIFPANCHAGYILRAFELTKQCFERSNFLVRWWLVLIIPIVARQSQESSTIGASCFFSVVTVGFLTLNHIYWPTQSLNYLSIISFDRTNARNRSCWAQRSKVHGCGVTNIDRLQLLSIARDYYRSPATIIARNSRASDYHYYCYLIFLHKWVLTKSTPF